MTSQQSVRIDRPLTRVAPLAILAVFALAMGLWAPGLDARDYYDADLESLYPGHVFIGAYNYSPAFAWWTEPLRTLPFTVWMVAISSASVAALGWLISPWLAVALLIVQLPPIWRELQFGNLDLIMAAVMVLGFRWPALYAFALLTKVTPGIGLVWFAVRREWRSVGIAVGTTALVVLPSLVAGPELWGQWSASLTTNAGLDGQIGVPVVVRAVVAGAVVAWGALTDRPWTVPVGAALLAHVNGFGWLAALGAVPLLRLGAADADRKKTGFQRDLDAQGRGSAPAR